MSASVTTKELRNSQIKDLERDLRTQEALVAKLRMGLQIQKEKDIAKYQREKKTIARMQTILTEKRSAAPVEAAKPQELRKKAKSSKLPARS